MPCLTRGTKLSSRARWISMALPYPMGRDELCDLLQRSHQLVVQRLPKRLQVGLLT